MGEAAETVAREHGIDRRRQDAFALRSHRRALEAAAVGRFDEELVPVTGARGEVTADNGPRPRLNAELLARFPAAFVDGGTVTAGNSCADADGAAAVLIATAQVARDLGTTTALAFRGASTLGWTPHDWAWERLPRRLGCWRSRGGRAAARGGRVQRGLRRAGARLHRPAGHRRADPQCRRRRLTLGHAYGASGAVSVVRLLARACDLPEGSLLLAMISSAGGIGTAALFEKTALPGPTR